MAHVNEPGFTLAHVAVVLVDALGVHGAVLHIGAEVRLADTARWRALWRGVEEALETLALVANLQVHAAGVQWADSGITLALVAVLQLNS